MNEMVVSVSWKLCSSCVHLHQHDCNDRSNMFERNTVFENSQMNGFQISLIDGAKRGHDEIEFGSLPTL